MFSAFTVWQQRASQYARSRRPNQTKSRAHLCAQAVEDFWRLGVRLRMSELISGLPPPPPFTPGFAPPPLAGIIAQVPAPSLADESLEEKTSPAPIASASAASASGDANELVVVAQAASSSTAPARSTKCTICRRSVVNDKSLLFPCSECVRVPYLVSAAPAPQPPLREKNQSPIVHSVLSPFFAAV